MNAWKSAEENETGVLDYLYTEWDNIINGGTEAKPTTPPEEPPQIITGNTVDDIKSKITGNEETPTPVKIGGREVVIPSKFTLAGSDAENPGGQTIPEGIVVIDPLGNEWVWVPCYVEGGKGSTTQEITNGVIKYDRYAFTRTEPTWEERQTKLTEKDADGSYKIVREDDTSYYFHEGLSKESPEYLSIKQYGGYYIGRYEAGDKESTELGINRGQNLPYLGTETIDGDATHTVTIKKNQVPYNYVLKEQSIRLSEEMSSDNGTDVNKLDGRKVFTKLCSSYSWDTAIKFIEKTHPTYGSTSTTKDGVVTGNHQEHLYSDAQGAINTGLTLPICSIYDMAGNVWEYTTESVTRENNRDIVRGGSFYDEPNLLYPSGSRGSYNGVANAFGFRVTLFIK